MTNLNGHTTMDETDYVELFANMTSGFRQPRGWTEQQFAAAGAEIMERTTRIDAKTIMSWEKCRAVPASIAMYEALAEILIGDNNRIPENQYTAKREEFDWAHKIAGYHINNTPKWQRENIPHHFNYIAPKTFGDLITEYSQGRLWQAELADRILHRMDLPKEPFELIGDYKFIRDVQKGKIIPSEALVHVWVKALSLVKPHGSAEMLVLSNDEISDYLRARRNAAEQRPDLVFGYVAPQKPPAREPRVEGDEGGSTFAKTTPEMKEKRVELLSFFKHPSGAVFDVIEVIQAVKDVVENSAYTNNSFHNFLSKNGDNIYGMSPGRTEQFKNDLVLVLKDNQKRHGIAFDESAFREKFDHLYAIMMKEHVKTLKRTPADLDAFLKMKRPDLAAFMAPGKPIASPSPTSQ